MSPLSPSTCLFPSVGEPDADQFGDSLFLHCGPVEAIGYFHCPLLVGNNDELAAFTGVLDI